MHQDMSDERPSTIDWKCERCAKLTRVYGPTLPDHRVCAHCGTPDPLHPPPVPEPVPTFTAREQAGLAFLALLHQQGRWPASKTSYCMVFEVMPLAKGVDGSWQNHRAALEYDVVFDEPGKELAATAKNRLRLMERATPQA